MDYINFNYSIRHIINSTCPAFFNVDRTKAIKNEVKIIYSVRGKNMKNKAILTLILSYVAVIGGLIMNFQEF